MVVKENEGFVLKVLGMFLGYLKQIRVGCAEIVEQCRCKFVGCCLKSSMGLVLPCEVNTSFEVCYLGLMLLEDRDTVQLEKPTEGVTELFQ